MACLLQPDRSGNPAVDALFGTAKKETGVITCCHSAVCIWAEGLDLCHSHHNWRQDP